MTMGAASHVLAGIRVVDVGRYIAGPYCAALLAWLGADVIRVEPPGGAPDRHIAPLGPGADGALFLQSNLGKRSLALDLSAPEGRDVLRRLVATADVVVANLPARALAALGLDYASVQAVRPDIILTTVSAFGDDGPERDMVGFDGCAQAMSGAMHLTGVPGEPRKAAAPYVDYGTALSAALGTVAALHARTRTGRGQHVEASLLSTALAMSGAMLTEEAVLHRNREGTANRAQLYGPADTFATRDGAVLVQVLGDDMFARCARLVGAEDWLDDPRMATDVSRGDHGEVLSARMAQWCASLTTDEALHALRARRVPCAPVLSPREALAHPQVRATNPFVTTHHEGIAGDIPVVRPPIRLTDGAAPLHHAPAAGEDTDEILASLGYDAGTIRALRARHVI